MTATGRKKLDELYHPVVDRSEFYSMSDTNKPPVLFSPAEDIDKVSGWALQCCVKTSMLSFSTVVVDGVARLLRTRCRFSDWCWRRQAIAFLAPRSCQQANDPNAQIPQSFPSRCSYVSKNRKMTQFSSLSANNFQFGLYQGNNVLLVVVSWTVAKWKSLCGRWRQKTNFHCSIN